MVELQKGNIMAYGSGWSSIVELQNGQVVSDALDAAFKDNIDPALAEIDEILNGAGWTTIQFVPQATAPATLLEGMMYYDLPTHSFVAINDIAGTKLNLGYELNERCSNHTLAIIPEAKVVAVSKVNVDTSFEIILAKADVLETAVAFGVTTSEFAIAGAGAVTKIGRVNGIDTLGLAANSTLYLSDTTAGGITGTPPSITTVVGHVVQEQSGVGIADGVIYIDIRSIISLPNVVAFMNQDLPWATPVTLGATPIGVTDYDPVDSGGIIMSYETLGGTILAPANGIYDMTIDFGTNYDDIGNNVQHLLVEIMADNGVDAPVAVGQYNKEVAKNSTSTNGSMTKTFNGVIDTTYYLQMSCPDASFANFVLENVSFSLKSIDIR